MSEIFENFRARVLTQAILAACDDPETIETAFDLMGIKKKPLDETLDTDEPENLDD